jgi:hypothetical protein
VHEVWPDEAEAAPPALLPPAHDTDIAPPAWAGGCLGYGEPIVLDAPSMSSLDPDWDRDARVPPAIFEGQPDSLEEQPDNGVEIFPADYPQHRFIALPDTAMVLIIIFAFLVASVLLVLYLGRS